jgi:hypothetical protein
MFFATEARVQSLESPCEAYGGQSGTGGRFFPSMSVFRPQFSFQQCSILISPQGLVQYAHLRPQYQRALSHPTCTTKNSVCVTNILSLRQKDGESFHCLARYLLQRLSVSNYVSLPRCSSIDWSTSCDICCCTYSLYIVVLRAHKGYSFRLSVLIFQCDFMISQIKIPANKQYRK